MSTIQSRKLEKKAKKHVTLTWKSPWKSCSTTHLHFLLSNPKTKMKPTKCPAKGKKKTSQEKGEKREERKQKAKSQDCCVTFKPPKILLSVHAWTLQANILHLDQKAAKCTTCKWLCGKFYLLIAWQWPENCSTSFKRHLSAKSPGANELSYHFLWFYAIVSAGVCDRIWS